MRGGKFAHSQVRDHLFPQRWGNLSEFPAKPDSVLGSHWQQSLAMPCFSISSNTSCCSTPWVISPYFCALAGQGGEGANWVCGERIWGCGLSPGAPAAPQPAPAVLFCTAHSGWKPSQQNGTEHLMGYKWQLWPRTHPGIVLTSYISEICKALVRFNGL